MEFRWSYKNLITMNFIQATYTKDMVLFSFFTFSSLLLPFFQIHNCFPGYLITLSIFYIYIETEISWFKFRITNFNTTFFSFQSCLVITMFAFSNKFEEPQLHMSFPFLVYFLQQTMSLTVVHWLIYIRDTLGKKDKGENLPPNKCDIGCYDPKQIWSKIKRLTATEMKMI